MKKPLIQRMREHLARNKKRYGIAAVSLLLSTCCVKWYGEWGASQLECNTHTLPSDCLGNVGPLKIAYMADVHNAREHFERIVDELKTIKPDLIIFGGDLVTADERFKRTRWAIEAFRKLNQIAPTFAAIGNHDYEKQEQVERVFNTAGVKLLRNEGIDWTTPSGKVLRIVGLGDYNEGDEAPEQCLDKKGSATTPVLLISHDPESRHLLDEYDWDLMLCGHTHGGQIGIPFTEHYISFRSDMAAGLYNYAENRHVFVTRGVGSTQDMRFFCNPEYNILIIPATGK